MYHDEISETLKEAIKQIGILKKQEDGFIEDCNKSSKRNAELTQKINKLTQENDKLKTKNDSLYEELKQSSYKIKDDRHEIHKLEGMLTNAMADIQELTEANDRLIDENEDLRAQRDCYKKDNDELKEGFANLVDRNEQLVEQIYQDEMELQEEETTKEPHPYSHYRYSYGQTKAFKAFAVTHSIPEGTLHKLYEALLEWEDGFDTDKPTAAETNYNNLLENLEHLVNCHVVSNSLTVKLNENGGE